MFNKMLSTMHWTIPKCVDILTEHSSFRYERNDIGHLSCFDTCAASHVWSCFRFIIGVGPHGSSWLRVMACSSSWRPCEDSVIRLCFYFVFLETYCLFLIECISKISILRDSCSIWPGRQVLISETPWTSWNLSLGWTNFRTSFMSFWFSTWIWRLQYLENLRMGVIYCTFHVVFDLWLKQPSWFAMCSWNCSSVFRTWSWSEYVRVRKIM